MIAAGLRPVGFLEPIDDEAKSWVEAHGPIPVYGEHDPCPQCSEADLENFGGKKRCPKCRYIQPCCNP